MSLAWRQRAGKAPSVMALLTMASLSQSPAKRLSSKKKSRNCCVKAWKRLGKFWHCWVPILNTAGIADFCYCQRILKRL